MIRSARPFFALLLLAPTPVWAAPAAKPRIAASKKASAKRSSAKRDQRAAPKPELVGSYGSWGAYVASGRSPTCYVLSKPDQRLPANLNRDPAYMFISTRPAEHVRNELSVVMGFTVKDTSQTPSTATIGNASFDMIAKGSDLWLKDESQDGAMLTAMKKGDKMIVKAASERGNVTTDTYSLKGLTQALAHVAKSCK